MKKLLIGLLVTTSTVSFAGSLDFKQDIAEYIFPASKAKTLGVKNLPKTCESICGDLATSMAKKLEGYHALECHYTEDIAPKELSTVDSFVYKCVLSGVKVINY